MPDGATVADHNVSAARQWAKLGRRPKVVAAEAPDRPPALDYLWHWFCELSLGLAVNGFVPPVVTWEALAAWCSLRAIAPEPWESLMLVRLGNLRAGILQDRKPSDGGQNKNRTHRQRPSGRRQ